MQSDIIYSPTSGTSRTSLPQRPCIRQQLSLLSGLQTLTYIYPHIYRFLSSKAVLVLDGLSHLSIIRLNIVLMVRSIAVFTQWVCKNYVP